MADILLSEDEFNRLKAVVTEAQALRNYLDSVRRTALRITPYHIEMTALRGALAAVSDIDLEHPRNQYGVPENGHGIPKPSVSNVLKGKPHDPHVVGRRTRAAKK